MFVNPEIMDHFPGEFANFYIIELQKLQENLKIEIGTEIEVLGYNDESFLYSRKDAQFFIPKTDAKILKKMIKAIKKKS